MLLRKGLNLVGSFAQYISAINLAIDDVWLFSLSLAPSFLTFSQSEETCREGVEYTRPINSIGKECVQ